MNNRVLPFLSPAGVTPDPTETVTFTLNSIFINGAANGRFGGISESFTIGGQAYTVTSLFTHNNGVQFRFLNNAQALAFIAADLLVDVDISGQDAFRTSLMENVAGIFAAQYRAFPGRFAQNTNYTITITT